jgi:hypothetical protein
LFKITSVEVEEFKMTGIKVFCFTVAMVTSSMHSDWRPSFTDSDAIWSSVLPNLAVDSKRFIAEPRISKQFKVRYLAEVT